jgi:hypothetical protein
MQDLKMKGSARRNIRMFEKLCGTSSFQSIILVTTNWDFLGDQATAMSREDELRTNDEYWGLMMKRDSHVQHHDGDRDSAMRILSTIVHINPAQDVSSNQIDLVERKRGYSESNIGIEFQSPEARVDQLLAEYTKVLDIPLAHRRWTMDNLS